MVQKQVVPLNDIQVNVERSRREVSEQVKEMELKLSKTFLLVT